MKIKQCILRFLALCLILSQLSPCVLAEEPMADGQWRAQAVTFAEDGRALFAGFVDRAFAGAAVPKKAAINAGSRLTGLNAALYARMKEDISRVASGTRHDTVFSYTPRELGIGKATFTAQELGLPAIASDNAFTEEAKRGAVLSLGLDLRAVLECLMEDMPYELYWFDKVTGAYESYSFSGNYVSISIEAVKVYLFVSADYAAASTEGNRVQNTTETRSDLSNVALAVKNAKEIVAKHADEPDEQKLMSYVQEISSLSASNYAASNDPNPIYGDPWQLIYVFDGDPDTMVVCEGFSKAMQYLCDMSKFQSDDIVCYTVMGSVRLNTGGAGGHMWNILHMDDGKNYMVDVTNYKSMNTAWCGMLGSVEEGYSLTRERRTLHYEYYDQTRWLFTKEELTLSTEDYRPHEHSFTATEIPPTCTEPGYTSYTCVCGDGYIEGETAALGHDLVIDPAVPATCTEAGLTEGSHCTRCDYRAAQKTVAALGHAIVTESALPATCTQDGRTEGSRCSRCDYRVDQEIIPALGHELVTEAAVPATCTQSGLTEGSHCLRCDYVEKAAVAAPLGHRYTAVVTAPTCLQEGITVHTCTRCGDSYEDDRTAALGHKYRSGLCTRCEEPEPICRADESCPGHPFTDMPKVSNWAHKGIDFCVSRNLMNGVSENIFRPNGTVTRGQLVTILYRIAGEPATTTENSFKDVKSGKFYTKAVIWAAENEIVNGYAGNIFKPDAAISREQIATILYRYAGSPAVTGTLDFPDAGKAGSYAVDALLWATQEGLINGVNSHNVTTLSPKTNATRAQIAAIIMRYLEAK